MSAKTRGLQILLTLLFTLCAGLSPAAAAEPPESAAPTAGKPLTREACIAVALAQNPLLRAAELGAAAAAEAAQAAKSPYYPSLSATAGYHRWDRMIFLPSGIEIPGGSQNIGETDDWDGALQAEIILYDSGRRRAELLAARAEAQGAGVEAEQARLDLVLLVNEAYFRLLGALAEARAAEEGVRRSNEHLRTTELRYDRGDVPQADVLRAKVDAGSARLTLVRTEGGVRTARADLNAAIGLPATLPIEIEEDYPEPLRTDGIDLEAAIRRALERRPELQVSDYETAAARHRVAAVKGSFGPRLQAEGKYGRRDERFLPEQEEWSAGVTLKIPLFTFEKGYRVAESRAAQARSEALREQAGLQVRQEVVKAFSDLEQAGQSVATAALMLADAQEGLRLTRSRYENGAGTVTDLLDTEAALADAEAAYARARADQQIAAARFLRATGDPATAGD